MFPSKPEQSYFVINKSLRAELKTFLNQLKRALLAMQSMTEVTNFTKNEITLTNTEIFGYTKLNIEIVDKLLNNKPLDQVYAAFFLKNHFFDNPQKDVRDFKGVLLKFLDGKERIKQHVETEKVNCEKKLKTLYNLFKNLSNRKEFHDPAAPQHYKNELLLDIANLQKYVIILDLILANKSLNCSDLNFLFKESEFFNTESPTILEYKKELKKQWKVSDKEEFKVLLEAYCSSNFFTDKKNSKYSFIKEKLEKTLQNDVFDITSIEEMLDQLPTSPQWHDAPDIDAFGKILDEVSVKLKTK